VKTPQQAAEAWVSSAGRAATNWSQGVQSYNGDWAGATTSQQAVMQTNWQQSVSSGRWAAGVQNVGTSGWKSATTAKAANFSVGFQAGASRQAAAISKIIAAEQQIVNSLPPRGDFNANVQRSVAVQTALHALKGQLGA
jgi:hypothetical protein